MRNTWTKCMTAALAMALLIVAAPMAMAQDKAAPAATTETKAAPAATATATETDPCSFLSFDSDFCKQVEDFIAKSKKPCDQFTWGADLRLRDVWGRNWTTLSDSANNTERHFERYRARVWGTLTPIKNIDINARLVWEPRVIQKGPFVAGINSRWVWDEVVFDNLNVAVKNIADLPLTVIVGRQDIVKGDGWIILDGTPLDGSRTIYFNAVRAIWEAEEIGTTFEVDYIYNDDDGDLCIKPFNQTHQPVIEQDERGLIFYVTNKSLEKTTLEGYYIYKHDTPRMATGADAELHTIGGRIVGQFTDDLTYRGEGAMQWGKEAIGAVPTRTLRAFGLNSRVTYFFRDKINNQVHADYEFLSGDDPDSAACEGFNPLWGRWPQWSELYAYTDALERGRPGELSNLHRLGFGWECDPCKVFHFRVNYHLLFADENSQRANAARFSGAGAFRGQLLESKLTYKLSKHVAGHLVAEYFAPGNFYNENVLNDPAIFLRYELTFTW